MSLKSEVRLIIQIITGIIGATIAGMGGVLAFGSLVGIFIGYVSKGIIGFFAGVLFVYIGIKIINFGASY